MLLVLSPVFELCVPLPVQADLFDNADGTDPNQRYVLNLVDLATKFILELFALRTKSAREVLLVVSPTWLLLSHRIEVVAATGTAAAAALAGWHAVLVAAPCLPMLVDLGCALPHQSKCPHPAATCSCTTPACAWASRPSYRPTMAPSSVQGGSVGSG